MARLSARTRPGRERILQPLQRVCPSCRQPMRIRYENRRTLVTLSGAVRLRLKIRRCEQLGCPRHHTPYRPEAEGGIALPQHEFGLDVIALVGGLRHREHRSVPEIHAALRGRGVAIAERSVTNLLDRYDELLAVSLTDSARLRGLLASQGRVILALDGLQPDVGHEVLWVVRDCLSGEVLLARSLLSGTADDLAALLCAVAQAIGVPVAGWSATGRPRSGAQWNAPCLACRISSASFTFCAKRRCRYSRPTGTPRCSSRRRYAACVGSSAPWKAATTPARRWCGATARRYAALSPRTAVRRSPPRVWRSKDGW